MHRAGYLAGAAIAESDTYDLARTFSYTAYARLDAVWVTPRYSGRTQLTGWPSVPNRLSTRHQRATFVSTRSERWGGVTMRVTRHRIDAPVATVAQPYRVTGRSPLRGRSSPSSYFSVVRTYAPGSGLRVLCQTSAQPVGRTRVWNRLADGNWVTDRYVSTPSTVCFSPPLPRCAYPFQTTAIGGLRTRTGPGLRYAAVSLPRLGQVPDLRDAGGQHAGVGPALHRPLGVRLLRRRRFALDVDPHRAALLARVTVCHTSGRVLSPRGEDDGVPA